MKQQVSFLLIEYRERAVQRKKITSLRELSNDPNLNVKLIVLIKAKMHTDYTQKYATIELRNFRGVNHKRGKANISLDVIKGSANNYHGQSDNPSNKGKVLLYCQ